MRFISTASLHLSTVFAAAIAVISPFLFFATIALPVQAGGSHSICATYGKLAAQQQRKNLRKGCGFSGPYWHKDEGAHYGWCRLASSSDRRAGTRLRRRMLTNCAAPNNKNVDQDVGRNDPCRTYARRGTDAQNSNETLGCRLRGSKWNASYEYHYNWCRRNGSRSRQRRQNDWGDTLRRCSEDQANAQHNAAGAGNDAWEFQPCGWFVILSCHRGRDDARNSLTILRQELGGPNIGGGAGTRVINTSKFKGMSRGYYCVVDGPYEGEQNAREVAWVESVPRAYVKRGCRR